MAGRRERHKAILRYPAHLLAPEDLLHFIELDGFVDDWKRLNLTDDDLSALQMALMATWRTAPVIEKTGGLRKLRFAPLEKGTGKSGAIRVCFKCFEAFGIVLLVVAYGKNERDDLSNDAKSGIRMYLRTAERELKRLKGVV